MSDRWFTGTGPGRETARERSTASSRCSPSMARSCGRWRTRPRRSAGGGCLRRARAALRGRDGASHRGRDRGRLGAAARPAGDREGAAWMNERYLTESLGREPYTPTRGGRGHAADHLDARALRGPTSTAVPNFSLTGLGYDVHGAESGDRPTVRLDLQPAPTWSGCSARSPSVKPYGSPPRWYPTEIARPSRGSRVLPEGVRFHPSLVRTRCRYST